MQLVDFGRKGSLLPGCSTAGRKSEEKCRQNERKQTHVANDSINDIGEHVRARDDSKDVHGSEDTAPGAARQSYGLARRSPSLPSLRVASDEAIGPMYSAQAKLRGGFPE